VKYVGLKYAAYELHIRYVDVPKEECGPRPRYS
jgi:hypothetical protein